MLLVIVNYIIFALLGYRIDNKYMYSIDELREIIKTELEKETYMQEPTALFEPLRYILEDGGKRLRPVLALMAYNLYREDIEKALKSVIGIEIFHNYTLLHDDVMDDAAIRRGRPTVHRKWNTNVAILSGDAAAITAYMYVESCEDKYLRRVLDGFNQVAMDVCKGQQLDMEFESRTDVTAEEYLDMIYKKTSVLIAGSLRHGALIAGASESDYNALYDFGGCLGLAFQLQDDLLDVYGNEKTFGKAIGGDIMENKKTYMLIKALEMAEGDDLQKLKEYIAIDDTAARWKIEAVTNIYNSVGVKAVAEAKINEYIDQSKMLLKSIDLPEERKALFYEMIDYLDGREK
ncbi:MAG: polyprenyl synthetase family protein [Marinifilaceae bacterium]